MVCHVQRKEEGDCTKKIMMSEVHGQRSRGRQRKRWMDMVKQDMRRLRVECWNAEDRTSWERRINVAVADPTLRD